MTEKSPQVGDSGGEPVGENAENTKDEQGIDTIRRVLRPALADNPRARRLQEKADEAADDILKSIKDEDRPDWAINPNLAFCYFSPLSRHHANEKIGELAASAFGKWAEDTMQDSGAANLYHEKAWRINSIVSSYIWYEDAFDAEMRAKLLKAFAHDAKNFRKRPRSGQVGNQEMAVFGADLRYAYVLSDPEYIAQARENGDAALRRTLNEDGQIVEQYGPCPLYSYLAYGSAFGYAMLTGSTEFDERLRNSLDWFMKYHTRSMYLIAGPSTRKFQSRESARPSDIYAGLEYFASVQPMYQKVLDLLDKISANNQSVIGQLLVNNCDDLEPTEEHIKEWNEPFARFYERIYYGRGPIKYALVSRRYQTGITFTGWLPLMGLQTWAWDDEPPIIHPPHNVPSGTQAWGIDTARFSCSHLYYKNGPGCMAADVAWRGDGSSRESLPDEPAFAVWRNGTLRTVAIFTDVSTVVILTGPTGKRTTQWTLNAVEQAKPSFEDSGLVRFEGRTGCIHALQAGKPRLLETETMLNIGQSSPNVDVTAQSLLYKTDGSTATAFAFSNGSFSAIKNDLDANGVLEFKDDGGTYRADISTIVDELGDLTYGLDTAKIKQTD